MPRRGGRRVKTRTHKKALPGTDEALRALGAEKVPRTFVLRRGQVDGTVDSLVRDFRLLMMPHTSARLRERRSNTLRDFISVAGPLGVTHMLLFSQTDSGTVNLRIGRLAQGPTLSFRVEAYSLSRQVKSAQRHPVDASGSFLTPPLVVLHNFSGAGAGITTTEKGIVSSAGVSLSDALKMTMITFQALFPAVNPATVKLADCRRVLLVHYNKTTNCIELRHYAVAASPVGITRAVKKVLKAKTPDLGGLDDVADFVLGGGAASDSEMEDESSHLVLPQDFRGRGNMKSQQSSIKLSEIGPRLSLSLVKIEGGLFTGETLYHSHIVKSLEEAEELRKRANSKSALRAQRRAQQEANVRQKEAEKKMKEKEKDAKRIKRQRTTELALKEGRDANMNEDERREEEDARVDPYEDDGLGGDVGADEQLEEEEGEDEVDKEVVENKPIPEANIAAESEKIVFPKSGFDLKAKKKKDKRKRDE
jgi:ribosome biogenesis protein SSF1/2